MTSKLPKEYVKAIIKVNEENYDPVIGLLSQLEINGIEEGYDELSIFFDIDIFNKETLLSLIGQIKELFPEIKLLSEEVIIEQNWNEEWEKTVDSIIVNENITIAPSWKVQSIKTKIIIEINPKMSFGTGSHETTRLMCRLIEETVKPGSKWLDMGTGTGVLAILEARLGARKVLAIDNDSWSVDNAIENVALNQVSDIVEVIMGDVMNYDYSEFDGISANLFKNLLIPSFPLFFKALFNNGVLLISGLLKYDIEEVSAAAEKAGFDIIKTIYENEWIAIQLRAVKS
jgi:ribosomal protein L11 methyltransferase